MGLVSQFERLLHHAMAPATLQADDGDDRVVCRVEELDSIGAATMELRLETPRLATLSKVQLSKMAEALAAKLNYLMEPIAPIEIDLDKCSVQLRSRPPRRSEATTSYYEVMVTVGGSIALVRYDKPKGSRRERVPMLLTREVMVRLVGDFDLAATNS